MSSDRLIEMLETYSNAIVGFVVLQSLAFSFTYGTSERFGQLVATREYLAAGLMAHFIFTSILAIVAITLLGNTIQRNVVEHRATLRKLYLAKTIAVLLFAVMPIVLLAVYGFQPAQAVRS